MSIENYGFPRNQENVRTVNNMKVSYARKALREIGERDKKSLNDDVKQSIENFISSVVELLEGERDELIVQIRNCLNRAYLGDDLEKEIDNLRNQLDKRFPENTEKKRPKSNTNTNKNYACGREIKYKM